jgi:hypothetical protein
MFRPTTSSEDQPYKCCADGFQKVTVPAGSVAMTAACMAWRNEVWSEVKSEVKESCDAAGVAELDIGLALGDEAVALG